MPEPVDVKLDGVTDDDPTIADDAEGGAEEEEVDFATLLADAEEDEEDAEAEGEPAKENKTTEDKANPQEQTSGKPKFTPDQQAEIDRIVAERLARDRKSDQVRQLETATGKTIEQVIAEQRAAKVQEVALNNGWDEERAEVYVKQQERLRQLEATEAETQRLQMELQKTRAYERSRDEYHLNPGVDGVLKVFSKQYAAEIDQVAKNGVDLDYPVAVAYVLGTKLPEIKAAIERSAEQKVLKNVQTRSKVRPESAGGHPQTPAPNKQERQLARAFGIPEKDWAEEREALRRMRGKR